MTIPYNHLRVTVTLRNLAHNYRLLSSRGSDVLAVVKADAYGHGLVPVAETLAEAGCETFAVGTVAEGVALRDAGVRGDVLSLLGPLDETECRPLRGYRIIPFIHAFDQFDMLEAVRPAEGKTLGIALKWDTGMRRLGFTEDEIPAVIERLRRLPHVSVSYVASHMATADDPDAFSYAGEQAAAFSRICAALREAGFSFKAALANSAGILAHPDKHFDVQRAGIALYGINPFAGTEKESLGAGLTPAMEVTTRIVCVHELKKGHSISYGRTFTAPRDMRVAVAAAGYADAYSRGLSNQGRMCLRGVSVPILGRVCMQLTAVDIGEIPDVAIGDEIHLLGGTGEGAVTPNDLAAWWGTIPYEVFCLLGLNRREYEQ